MVFARGVVLEVISPFLVDGEMVMPGDLIEVPTRDADDLKARKKAKDSTGKTSKREKAAA